MPSQGTTASRGYGTAHQRQRGAWEQRLQREGSTHCHASSCLDPAQPIRHGDQWDLGHTDDRTAWTGPEHPACNRAAGGRRSAANATGQHTGLRHSRTW